MSLVVGHGGNAAAITRVAADRRRTSSTVRAGLEDELAELQTALPAGLRLDKTYDLAAFVETAIANVRDAILVGGVLAVLVLLVFLRDFRLTLVAACTLPLTVVSTFFFMWLVGESINLMSMGGIAVAIGLVIDDAVVVVENIHRRMAAGGGPNDVERGDAGTGRADRQLDAHDGRGLRAARPALRRRRRLLQGALDHADGGRADFARAGAVADSDSRARRVSPQLREHHLRRPAMPQRITCASTRPETGHDTTRGPIERLYVATLPPLLQAARLVTPGRGRRARRRRRMPYTQLGTGFFPAADEGGFVIDYFTPPGMALEDTDARMKQVEAILNQTPEVADVRRGARDRKWASSPRSRTAATSSSA